MAQQQLILAIGRIERALSRLEQLPGKPISPSGNPELEARHEKLKGETKAAINDIDKILAGAAN
jgi:hypothetical protein